MRPGPPHRESARTLPPPAFDGYDVVGRYGLAFDEMFDDDGRVRAPYKGIYDGLAPTDVNDSAAGPEAVGRAFQGITFSHAGQEDHSHSTSFLGSLRPWSGRSWRRGIKLRVSALGMFSPTCTASRRSCEAW